MTTSGLTLAISRILGPNKTSEESFNHFYNSERIPAALNTGLTSLVLRYKNADLNSTKQYLAVYPISDAASSQSQKMAQFIEDTKKSTVLNSNNIYDFIDFDVRHFIKTQTFEVFGHASKQDRERGQTLVMVVIEPAEGLEQEFEDWYRKQHLDMLAMCTGYRRTAWYERTDGAEPRFLALHEYDCRASELPKRQMLQVTSTE